MLRTNVAIDCQFSSDPNSTVVIHYLKNFENNIQTVEMTKIEITNVARSNEGVYNCESGNMLISGAVGRYTLQVTLTTDPNEGISLQ